ncbi:RodZ domain-containing protein [Thiocystis violacea]|uniref:RodZ domain-containing protein n=1 Tax=Thiocystis violacea TaxID=13725 RepID=UPI001904F208|nr:RodZ domain-containing protein [Thiocystis violacea]MBK1717272.1 hypothetical protein [Thiocystis violacea]
MSQSNTTSPDDQGTVDHTGSPGAQLRALRQSRGLDIERIAAQLHLVRPVVEAMEQDRYESLPSPVFVVGYLRNYARLLGADPAPIIGAYRSLVPAQDIPMMTALAQSAGGSSAGGNRWGWLIGLALVGMASALVVFWWSGRMVEESPTASSGFSDPEGGRVAEASGQAEPTGFLGDSARGPSSRTERPEASVTAPIDSFGSAASVPAEAIPLRRPDSTPASTAPTDAAPSLATAPAVNAAAPSEPEPPASPPTREVVLEFTGASWVDVRGADGKVVLNGEMRAGDRRVLTGQPPYKLVIGNAAATRMSVAGQVFDLNRRAQGNVARFSLDPNVSE